MSQIPFNEGNLGLIRIVGDDLLGTCKHADFVIEDVFSIPGISLTDLDIKLLEELDEITMQCEACGWWCETGFLNDEQICDDCEPQP